MSGPSSLNGANALPIYDAGLMIASDGVAVPTGQLSPTFGYDGSSNLTSITYTYLGHTYVQTLTYSGSNVTNISLLVKTA